MEVLDQPNLPEKARRKCENLNGGVPTEVAKLAAKHNEGHYRYEFDLGSGPPELVKMLWVYKDKDNNVVA